MNRDFYEILNVLPSATQEEIKRRYHHLAKTLHPDKVRHRIPFIAM